MTNLEEHSCGQGPCYGRNNSGISNDRLYTEEAIRLIEANDPTVPFFMCETYPRPTFLSILPPFTFPTFRSRDVKCVREQVPGAAAEPRAAASGAALHGDVPGIAVLGPAHHERYVHLL